VGQVANLRGGWLPPPARGSGPIDNRPQLAKLPHMAASRKREGELRSPGKLKHAPARLRSRLEIVAAREEMNGS